MNKETTTPKRLKLIACEIFFRELSYAASQSQNQVDIAFLPKALHDVGKVKMRERLQTALDAVDPEQYDLIALGYGLCNLGLVGLRSQSLPIVVPRAHDCITLFMGSRKRYQNYFETHAGVYFKTSGWIERGDVPSGDQELRQLSIQHRQGMDLSYDELVQKYGADNAAYLIETLGNLTPHYQQYTYIEMGIEPDSRFEETTRQQAKDKGYQFEHLQGDMTLIQNLLDGPWNEQDYLWVPPGHQIIANYNDTLIDAERISHEQP